MSCILCIETATNVCSVAVAHNKELIFHREETEGPSHASLLGVFVDEALKLLQAKNLQLDAVAVSCGPGSYTGLRIGVSEAKGVCYALGIPLIAIETLELLTYPLANNQDEESKLLFCPMIDARRMEVYTTLYSASLEKLRDTTAEIIDENSFSDLLVSNKLVFFGNGAEKCKAVLTSENAVFVDGVYPSAKDMISLAEKAFEAKNFVDVAYYEPFYLKDFVATTPKNKVLGANS